ncbi:hypothetical protein K504DRAFT_503020 [Pleomassaria siparia CBS 279.74]|uniref:Uncharacterized protein n=1 Tax=Pleomassaria siparia CBS 279.74 TaxID=1314801 RepID=A0A6G1K877_9PLEO|nr:hypothetical protein K504DRAFT_503020 [Pleomassaria siparia CBS 279.74]
MDNENIYNIIMNDENMENENMGNENMGNENMENENHDNESYDNENHDNMNHDNINHNSMNNDNTNDNTDNDNMDNSTNNNSTNNDSTNNDSTNNDSTNNDSTNNDSTNNDSKNTDNMNNDNKNTDNMNNDKKKPARVSRLKIPTAFQAQPTASLPPLNKDKSKRYSAGSASIANHDTENAALREQISKLELDLVIAKTGHEEAEEEYRILKDEVAMLRVEAAHKAKYSDENRLLNEEAQGFHQDFLNGQHELEMKHQQLAAKEKELLDHKTQISDMKEQVTAGQEVKKALETELEALKVQAAHQPERTEPPKLVDAERESSTEKDLLAAKDQLAATAQQLLGRDDRIKTLELRIAEVERDAHEKEMYADRFQEMVLQLGLDKAELKAEIEDLHEIEYVKVPGLEQQIKGLRMQLGEMDEEEPVQVFEDFENKIELLEAQVAAHLAQDKYNEASDQQVTFLHEQLGRAADNLHSKSALVLRLQKQLDEAQSAPEKRSALPLHNSQESPIQASAPESFSSSSSSSTSTLSNPLTSPRVGETGDPIVISITIDPNHTKHWKLVQKIRSAVSKNTPIDISGPKDLVLELQKKFYQVQIDHEEKAKMVEENQDLILDQLKEIERLEARPDCTVAEHEDLMLRFLMLEEKANINTSLLAQYDAQLKKAKEEREDKGVAPTSSENE